MREAFEKIGGGERHTFTGTFVRIGSKGGRTQLTVLLQDIRLAGGRKVLTDHAWFNYTDGFKALDLSKGDVVRFDARVDDYKKGYWGDNPKKIAQLPPPTVDYKLSRPTKISKTGKTAAVREVAPKPHKKRIR